MPSRTEARTNVEVFYISHAQVRDLLCCSIAEASDAAEPIPRYASEWHFYGITFWLPLNRSKGKG
jgi:hypothetical protein